MDGSVEWIDLFSGVTISRDSNGATMKLPRVCGGGRGFQNYFLNTRSWLKGKAQREDTCDHSLCRMPLESKTSHELNWEVKVMVKIYVYTYTYRPPKLCPLSPCAPFVPAVF